MAITDIITEADINQSTMGGDPSVDLVVVLDTGDRFMGHVSNSADGETVAIWSRLSAAYGGRAADPKAGTVSTTCDSGTSEIPVHVRTERIAFVYYASRDDR